MNAHGLAKAIGELAYDHGVYDEFIPDDIDVLSARTFDETGLLTSDDGVVIKLRDGSEFQVTVVQSVYTDLDREREEDAERQAFGEESR